MPNRGLVRLFGARARAKKSEAGVGAPRALGSWLLLLSYYGLEPPYQSPNTQHQPIMFTPQAWGATLGSDFCARLEPAHAVRRAPVAHRSANAQALPCAYGNMCEASSHKVSGPKAQGNPSQSWSNQGESVKWGPSRRAAPPRERPFPCHPTSSAHYSSII